MSQPSAPTPQTPLRNLARGATFGAALSLLFIAVGVVRGILLLAFGHRMPPVSGKDLRELAFYVGGFTIAGALVGVSWQFLPGKLGKYLAFAIAGSIVMIAIAAGVKGLGALDTFDWVMLPVLGAVLGLAGGLGYMNRR